MREPKVRLKLHYEDFITICSALGAYSSEQFPYTELRKRLEKIGTRFRFKHPSPQKKVAKVKKPIKEPLEFYAFAINEFRYKTVSFRRFKSQVKAEAWAHRPYKGTAQSDLSAEVLVGRSALEAWAKECDYTIDWNQMVLFYNGE